jgi:hypothetical protein
MPVGEDRRAPAAAAATRAAAAVAPDRGEAAELVGGWTALLDGWDEQLHDRQERAWEAEDDANRARQAEADWLRLLTAVSRLAAPDRDALRGYLTTSLPAGVLAALLRMSDDDFCAVLARAIQQLLAVLAGTDATAPLTAILTPPRLRAGKRARPTARPCRDVA